MLTETASQTAGPYLHIGMMPKAGGHRRPLGARAGTCWPAPRRRASASGWKG